MQKLPTFLSKNISVYAIFNDQSFNDTLTNDIVSFKQLGPGNFFFSCDVCDIFAPNLYRQYIAPDMVMPKILPIILGIFILFFCQNIQLNVV